MDTHASISVEIEKNKKNVFYLGDSQDQSMLKNNGLFSKIEISRAPGDPNFDAEYNYNRGNGD